jgi:hypothetical protein
VIITAECANSGPGGPGPVPSIDVGDVRAKSDGEDLVRPGDEHVKGVESLCVGESQ